MSEDRTNEPNPAGDFLVNLHARVAAGESAYGAVGSPAQVAKMAELDAKLGLARQLGEAPPAPEPWSVERAAKERLEPGIPGRRVAADP